MVVVVWVLFGCYLDVHICCNTQCWMHTFGCPHFEQKHGAPKDFWPLAEPSLLTTVTAARGGGATRLRQNGIGGSHEAVQSCLGRIVSTARNTLSIACGPPEVLGGVGDRGGAADELRARAVVRAEPAAGAKQHVSAQGRAASPGRTVQSGGKTREIQYMKQPMFSEGVPPQPAEDRRDVAAKDAAVHVRLVDHHKPARGARIRTPVGKRTILVRLAVGALQLREIHEPEVGEQRCVVLRGALQKPRARPSACIGETGRGEPAPARARGKHRLRR
eukprot:SAG11_NODE_4463_length_1886_cov_4.577504_1_plen_275_part_00